MPVLQKRNLARNIRITHGQTHHKPIHLGFRQQLRADRTDRVLRSDYDKRLRQLPGHTVHRHPPLFHHLQQRRLRNNSGLDQAVREIKKVIVGKDEIIEKVLIAILAKGHVLIEDIPGVGKTTLALALSRVLQLDYRRMQFTPDVLPSDVIGFQMYTGTSRAI